MALRPTWPGAETKPPGKEDPAQRGGVTRGTVQLTAHWPLLVVALLLSGRTVLFPLLLFLTEN